jgi:hypothetical protein
MDALTAEAKTKMDQTMVEPLFWSNPFFFFFFRGAIHRRVRAQHNGAYTPTQASRGKPNQSNG